MRAEYPNQLDYSGSCTYASPLFLRALWQCSCPRSSAMPASLRRLALQARGSRHAPEVSATFASKRPSGMCIQKAGGHRRPSWHVRRGRGKAKLRDRESAPGLPRDRPHMADSAPQRVRTCSRLASCASRRVASCSSQAAAAQLVARGSRSPKVVSSTLAGRVFSPTPQWGSCA